MEEQNAYLVSSCDRRNRLDDFGHSITKGSCAMKPVWKTKVLWHNGESVRQDIVATSQVSAQRAARKLAMDLRPYNGSPFAVSATLKPEVSCDENR